MTRPDDHQRRPRLPRDRGGRVELDANPFVVRDAVEASLDIIAPAAASKELELVYAIDDAVPVALVGDVGRLRQILLNLLSNAVKFTERGEVVLTVGGQKLAARGRDKRERWELRIDVRDTGIGIPSAMDRLFRHLIRSTRRSRSAMAGRSRAGDQPPARRADGRFARRREGIAGEARIPHHGADAGRRRRRGDLCPPATDRGRPHGSRNVLIK